ncbi:juvenile hormone esterase-like [Diachasmimorpha longicaudata]|uniref:juvenile hormone esterase-like n=1 Tax=Diachasmimorpha longicaudata TaxID=58733 RepID=UPI0030B8C1CE
MPSCAVQGCKSGYSTNPEKVHFFSVPKKELTEWRIALNRDDLSAGRAVCEKHFRTQEIDWKERVAIIRNGQVFGKTSLKIPRRKKGVVPSIFPWTEDWDSQQPKDLVASHRRSVIDIGEAIDEGLGSDNSFPRPDNDASNAVPIHENQENLESPLDIPSTSNFSDSENLGSSENACASPCCSNEAADSVSSRENVDNLTPSINFNEMARTSFKLPEGWLQEVKSTNDGNVLNFFVTKIIENKDSLNGPNLVIPVIWKAILIKSNLIPQCYVLHQPWDYVDRAPIRHIEEIQNLINTIDGLNVCTGPLLHDEFDQSKCSILHKDITADQTDVVQTTKGPVRGEILRTIEKNISYASFNGIPLARPPVGKLRFQAPVEVQRWSGIVEAVGHRKGCPQFDTEYVGDENCLFINVYTPQTKFGSQPYPRRPVMVWMYGSFYTVGSTNSSNFGPDFLIDQDVVVVYISSRLGALGFLSLNHPNATGNAGLKDQLLGLQWVQKNIRRFGGDAHKVTIFGQGSGAASVELLTLSDKAKGLFRNSIAMSGSPLNVWGLSTQAEAQASAQMLASQLNLTANNPDELLTALSAISAEDIVMASEKMFKEGIQKGLSFELLFRPVSEDESVSKDAVVTGDVLEKYKTGKFHRSPHLMGWVNAEASGLFPPSLPAFPGVTAENAQKLLDNLVAQAREMGPPSGATKDFFKKYSAMITRGYLDPTTKRALWNEAIQVISKVFYASGIQDTHWYRSSNETSLVYYYRNSFSNERLLHNIDGLKLNGVGHSDDLTLIFWMPTLYEMTDAFNFRGKIQRERVVKMWTNFARFRNPTPDRSDSLLGITWHPSRVQGAQLAINEKLSLLCRHPPADCPFDPLGNRISTTQKPVL